MNAKHPMQPVIRDDSGVARFKPNKIVRWLLDQGRPHGLDMNRIAVQNFPQEDEEHFAQLIGYSINGFCELSYVSEAAKDVAVGLEALINQIVPPECEAGMEFTPRPAKPDGSMDVAQFDLFIAITQHLAKRHPGLMVNQAQVNEIIRAADIIVAAYAKPTKEVPCVPPAATQSNE